MRDSYYLPWEVDGECDITGRWCVAYLAHKVAEHTRWTVEQVKEKLYRLIGWLCK